MSLWLSSLLDALLLGMGFSIYFILVSSFFQLQIRRKLRMMGTLIGSFVLAYLTVEFIPPVLPRQICLLILFTVLTAVCYRPTPAYCFFSALSFLIITNLAFVITMFGFTAITGQDAADFPFRFYFLTFISRCLSLFLVGIVHLWRKAAGSRKTKSSGKQSHIGFLPWLTLICAVLIYLASIRIPEFSPIMLAYMILLLLSDLCIIILLSLYEQQQQTLAENRVLQLHLDTANSNIAAIKQSYENERRMTHDFQNQIIALRGMLEGGTERSEIVDYLNEISLQSSTASLSITTNRPAADALLNQKYLYARQQKIDFQARLDDLSRFPLPDNALVVLLSNLLDNAVEACQKIPDEKQRRILIKMSVGGNDCLLSVENTVSGPVEIHDNLVDTTKPNPEEHGYGLKNVAAIVERYSGYYTIRCEDGIFIFAAVFPGLSAGNTENA